MLAAFEADDLTTTEVMNDPYTYFGGLRESDPVHWNDVHHHWVVTRHADVAQLIRNHEIFSSDLEVFPDPPNLVPPIDGRDLRLADYMNETMRPFMLHDRPEHLAMRQAIHRFFTPRTVERWRQHLRETARERIEQRLPNGGMEVKADFAQWVPLTTISWILDIPVTDAQHLRDLTDTLVGTGFSPGRMRQFVPAWCELQEYFEPLIEKRGASLDSLDAENPDLISIFAQAEREGAFTRTQSVASVVHVMIAGHMTTLNLIANSLLTFLRHPDQWELLRSDPTELAPNAVEECLRYEPSIKGLFRQCKVDTTLHDKQLRAGDRVFWVIASANRDPRVFEEPEEFDIQRSPNPHLAFGGGIHHCLGAALARVEGQEAFRVMAELLPPLRHDEAVEYIPNILDRELRDLRVTWT